MNEAGEDELTNEDVRQQLEETLGKEAIEKQLVSHRRESQAGHYSPQESVVDDAHGRRMSLAKGWLDLQRAILVTCIFKSLLFAWMSA